MSIRQLEWDSAFFGLRIGRADIESVEDTTELASLRDVLCCEYDLLYVFDSNQVGFNADAALMDQKVLYTKICEHKFTCKDVSLYEGTQPSENLYHLAHVSGGYSRFKLDSKFPKGSFEKLYDRWIENACPQKGTNKQIFIYPIKGVAKGMITVDYNMGGSAHIGLVAVDTECQHNGIGSKIMDTIEEYLYQQGTVQTLEVPTQKANVGACRWYEKNGFKVENIIDIYHWWL